MDVSKFITPTAIVASVAAYIVFIKQKKFEQKLDYYKKVRVTTSNLLSIWSEYSILEKFLKSNDPTNFLIYKVPELAEGYLKINQAKIEEMKKSFINSIENLKEIDVILFFKLENSLDNFHRINDEILYPILNNQEIESIEKKEILIPVLDDLQETLEEIIIDTSAHLPRKERNKVKKLLNDHLSGLKENVSFEDVPDFLIKLLNKKLKLKEPITKQELGDFYENETVIWLMDKLFSYSSITQMLFSKDHNIVNVLFALVSLDTQKIAQIIPIQELESFSFTENEAIAFKDNKAFYRLVMGIIQKVEGKVSFKIRRAIVKINNGEISLAQSQNVESDN